VVKQSKDDGVTVQQSTNHPEQVDTYVRQEGSREHVHVATDKQTGKEIGQWWRPNKPAEKKK